MEVLCPREYAFRFSVETFEMAIFQAHFYVYFWIFSLCSEKYNADRTVYGINENTF